MCYRVQYTNYLVMIETRNRLTLDRSNLIKKNKPITPNDEIFRFFTIFNSLHFFLNTIVRLTNFFYTVKKNRSDFYSERTIFTAVHKHVLEKIVFFSQICSFLLKNIGTYILKKKKRHQTSNCTITLLPIFNYLFNYFDDFLCIIFFSSNKY